MQLSATNGNSSAIATANIPVTAGDQVTFGGWINLQSGTGAELGWTLAVFNSSGTAIAIAGPSSHPSSPGWTYQSNSFTIPAGAAYCYLYAQIYLASGTTVEWVDDAFISSGTKYYHQDHLSNRMITSAGGNVLEQMGHYPFGEAWYNASGDKLLFTTYERDSESGNDYAHARYYVSRLGRFLSLDPIAGNINDPQSLNHYAYVRNNPIRYFDPDGTNLVEGCGFESDCSGGGGDDSGAGDTGDDGGDGGDAGDGSGGGTSPPIVQQPPTVVTVTATVDSFTTTDELLIGELLGYKQDFNFIESVMRQAFQNFLKKNISQDCVEALKKAFGQDAMEKLQHALDSTKFFDVNALAPQPAADFWGNQGHTPVNLGGAFDVTQSTAYTQTGTGPGVQQGIYSRGGLSTFLDQDYLLTHELSHIVQGQAGVQGGLDLPLALQLGLKADANTASQVLSDFFNSECAGFNKKK